MKMTDFNYKKYSLENLENWMHDAMSCAEATPQEIYDVIKSVVEDNYYTYKHQVSQAYELLALLNGNGKGHLSCDKDDQSEECKGAWTSFWEESSQYTDEEMNAMCDAAEKQEKLRQMTYDEAVALGWKMTDDGFWIREDKVTKWILPVELDGPSGEYFISLPDDLQDASGIHEGDQIEWVDNGDGSYTIRKVTKEIKMEEC
jgi:hypothetical protein